MLLALRAVPGILSIQLIWLAELLEAVLKSGRRLHIVHVSSGVGIAHPCGRNRHVVTPEPVTLIIVNGSKVFSLYLQTVQMTVDLNWPEKRSCTILVCRSKEARVLLQKFQK